MKICRKSVGIVTAIFMLCNFFVVPINNVFADDSNDVEDYISDIQSISNNVNNQIISMGTGDCLNDKECKYALDNIKKEYNDLKDIFVSSTNSLGNSVSLEKLLTDSVSPLLSDFNNNFNEDIIIDFDLINDITYEDGGITKPLITSSDLLNLIKSTYLSEHYTDLNDMNINFSSVKNYYVNEFNDIKDDYDYSKSEINGIINEINNFKNTELALGNNPNMSYGDTDVISKLSSNINLLDEAFKNILSSLEYNNEFDPIVEDSLAVRNAFYINNSDMTEDLSDELDGLISDYLSLENDLNTINPNINITNIDYSKVIDLTAAELDNFVSAFQDGIILNNDYNDLMNKINKYLKRKPSEKSLLDSKISELKSYNEKLNSNFILSMYSNFVNNANLDIENNVDSLMKFTGLVAGSKEHNALSTAKYKFYYLGLVDSSKYNISIDDNYLVIDGKGNIASDSFNNNLVYKHFNANGVWEDSNNFQLSGTGDIIDNSWSISLTDANDYFCSVLNIVIKGDFDGNGLVNNKDVTSLKNKLLKNSITDLDKIIGDFNKDNIVNIKDLTILNSRVNNITNTGVTTDASFKVKVLESNDKITYNVYLKTDGVIKGFEFYIKTSSNLKISSIKTLDGVSYNSNISDMKVVGLGEYSDNELLISITYSKNTDKIDTEFDIEKGLFVFDNSNYLEGIGIYKIIPAVKEVSNNDNNSVNNTVQTSNNDEDTDEIILDSMDDTNDIKSPISGDEVDTNDIIWGNIIKIALIVLLGALVIYFLNRDSKEEEDVTDNVKSKKDKS